MKLVQRLADRFTGERTSLAPHADEKLVRLEENPRELPLWLRQIKRRIGYRRNLAALGLIGRKRPNALLIHSPPGRTWWCEIRPESFIRPAIPIRPSDCCC